LTTIDFRQLEPGEIFFNWQGNELHFEPLHEGQDREGIAAYDGVDLVGSLT
jgi:hypothetical protein